MLEVGFTKGRDVDAVDVHVHGQALASFAFPKKGPIPHDGVHAIVEDALGFQRGFWGLIAQGVAPEDVQALAKAGGHASASRAATPDPSIVELIQAERLVECFEADFWGAPADGETFRGVANAACTASFVPHVDLDDALIAAIRARIHAFAAQWTSAPIGARVTLCFPVTV